MPEIPPMTPEAQEAYDKALRSIAEFQQRGNTDTELDLADLGLTTLPPELGQLADLTRLNLYNNQLTSLPAEIGQLSALTELYLGSNLLDNLPPEIGQLSALTTLHLYNNKFTTLPPEIGQLSALIALNLGGNQLDTLPPEIGQLIALTELNLDENQLDTLPPEMGQLTTLRALSIHNNQLRILPPEIGQLTALTHLYLGENLIRTLQQEIGQLTALTQLYLFNNQLSTLPPEIGQLRALTKLHLGSNQLRALPPEIGQLNALRELYLHGNPRLGMPAEVLGPRSAEVVPENKSPASPQAILEYYFAHRQAAEAEGTEPLLEAKVLVLGEASVGKSCLIAALTQGKRRTEIDGKGTSGIVRQLWEVPVKGADMAANPKARGVETLRLNCWDFGGQEIYHSAHTLFLTTRAVYLIVLSKRDNDRQNNVDYWLRMAASFGGPDAVIYVVVNKCDEKVGHPPDEQTLRLRHPHLRGFLHTSCDDLTGIPEAREVVVHEALRLEGVRTPVAKSWLAVKKKLEKMPEHTLSMDEWAQLCGSKINTAEARRELLHLCDRLGTVRYFPTTKENMVDAHETAILNPEWVTMGIYALLDDEATQKRGGLLDRTQMTTILKKRGYPPAHEKIIEEVMRRFDLLYDSADHGPAHRMLIPLMLPELMPVFDWPQAGTLEFVYQYEVMPAALLPAFMARRHEQLDATVPNWRHGCVLELKQCRVRVIADTETRRVLISVTGEEALRREALDQVRHTFEALHGAVDKLPVQELIPVPGRPDAPMLKYGYLRSLLWKGITGHEAEGSRIGETITVNVREALDGVRGTERRKQDEEQRQRAGDTHNHFHGDYKPMHTDNRIQARDITNSQVGQTLTNCTNMIQQQAAGEVRKLLEALERDVRFIIDHLPPEKVKEGPKLEKKFTELITQATSVEPEREWYDISAKGLLEASTWVKDFTGNIAGTIGNLGKVLWPGG